MAAPTETDVDVVQGQTFSMQVTWADESVDPPAPISLNGYRAHMQVRSRAGSSGAPLLDLTSDGDDASLHIEPNGQTGVVVVRISASDTAKLTKNCAYDLFVVNTADPTEATRLIFGKVTVSKSVTVNS